MKNNIVVKSIIFGIKFVLNSPLSVAVFAIFTSAFLALVVINLVLPFVMSLEKVAVVADIFNKSAFGFGTLLAGLGSFAYLETYIEKEKIKIRKRMYEKLYPKEQFGKGKRFNVVQGEGRKGKLYLLDDKKRSKRHIGNYVETYIELGWDAHGIITISDEEFYKLSEEEEPILISGRVGR